MAGQTLIVPTYVDPTPPPLGDATARAAATPVTPPPSGPIPAGDGVNYYMKQHVLQPGATVSASARRWRELLGGLRHPSEGQQYHQHNYMLPGQVC
jgi:hypothetical protein